MQQRTVGIQLVFSNECLEVARHVADDEGDPDQPRRRHDELLTDRRAIEPDEPHRAARLTIRASRLSSARGPLRRSFPTPHVLPRLAWRPAIFSGPAGPTCTAPPR